MTATTCAMEVSFGESGLRVDVLRVAVDDEVGVHTDRSTPLLGDLAEEARRTRQQGEATQQLDRESEVRQCGSTDAGAVEREAATEDLLVHAAHGLEEPQVRTTQALLVRD